MKLTREESFFSILLVSADGWGLIVLEGIDVLEAWISLLDCKLDNLTGGI